MSRLAGERADDAADRIPVVERVRVLPALPERVGECRNCRAPDLGLDVVPGRTVPIGAGELDRLRVAQMAGVVMASVAQVDPAQERDVVVRSMVAPSDEQLLVVAAAAPHTLVEQYLAPGRVDA